MNLSPGSTALGLALGLGMYLNGPAAAQQIQFACDANDDGPIDATESRLCTDAEFDKIAPGEQALTEKRLKAMAERGRGIQPTFADIDANGDGQISRDEGVGFSDLRFAGATEASGGRMSNEDYESWRGKGMQGVQP